MARDRGPGIAVLTRGPVGSPETNDDKYLTLFANRLGLCAEHLTELKEFKIFRHIVLLLGDVSRLVKGIRL